MTRRLLAFSFAASASITAAVAQTTLPDFPRVPATEPAKAADTFRGLDGFRMDLLAAEPLVTDPVAMAYDEDGRAFVAEMNDYPYTDAATHQAWKENTTDAPIGKIRLLIDEDGDGDFDRSTIFADKLSWPTGVACYKGGVFVCATPDVWYFKDTDNDGVADVKRKVFTGLRKYNVQAVSNNLVWGPDNKIYGAGGSNGGTVRPGEDCESKFEPLTMSRNDFRFDPAKELFELISGGARFGNAFDDFGNRFICNIRNPCQHVVIDDLHYLTRNPHAPIASVVRDVAKSGDALPVFRISPVEAWRDVRANRLVRENTKQPRSELVAGGVVTSASGITIYRGDAYPPEFRNMFFLGEVANNLIHRQQLKPEGVTFSSGRVDNDVDFVASTDVWFRPVNFVNAPDGTLHVLDMYRECIEHPWSIPDDIRAKLDLRSGADRGRIYRLAPKDFDVPKPPQLSKATTKQLVDCLSDRNAWWRETAQRLLVERGAKDAVPLLREVAASSPVAVARIHALWTLEGLRETDVLTLEEAMRLGSPPGVGAHAIRIAERHLKDAPELFGVLFAAAADGDVRVRFQAALSLGETDDPHAASALALILQQDAADPWMTAAVMSSAGKHADAIVQRLSRDPSFALFASTAPGMSALRQLAQIAGGQNQPETVLRLMSGDSTPPAAKFELALGLGESQRAAKRTLRDAAAKWDAGGANAAGVAALDGLLRDAATLAADAKAPADERVRGIRLLAFEDFARAKALLPGLLDPRQPPEVQRAAVAALAAHGGPEVGKVLMAGWRSYTPPLKADVVQAMLGYADRLPTLFDALEAGTVLVHDVPATRRPALLNHANEAIRTRAEKIFGAATAQTAARKDVIDRYVKELAGIKGNADAGRAVYESACATCHKLDDQGAADVGPNLATVRQWGDEQLVTNILDPNREVAPTFVEYVVQLADGETLSGVVAEETGNSLTLKLAGGAVRVLPRSNVKRIAASKLSLMPEGLEAGITPQQMADLLAFMRGGGRATP